MNLDHFFVLAFVGTGLFELWKAARALRSGRIVSISWLRRRTICREDDLTEFNATLALTAAGGVAFLVMAAFVFSTPF